jgi:hypothetical protein
VVSHALHGQLTPEAAFPKPAPYFPPAFCLQTHPHSWRPIDSLRYNAILHPP